MRTQLLLLILTLFAFVGQAQNRQTFNYNGLFNYDVEWTNIKDNYTIKLYENNVFKDSFDLKPLRPETFTTAFKDAFITSILNQLPVEKDERGLSEVEKVNTANHQATKVLYVIQAQSIATLDYRPKAGTIVIKDTLTVYKFVEEWKLACNNIKKGLSPKVAEQKEVLDTLIATLSEMEGWLIAQIESVENKSYKLPDKNYTKRLKRLSKKAEKAFSGEALKTVQAYLDNLRLSIEELKNLTIDKVLGAQIEGVDLSTGKVQFDSKNDSIAIFHAREIIKGKDTSFIDVQDTLIFKNGQLNDQKTTFPITIIGIRDTIHIVGNSIELKKTPKTPKKKVKMMVNAVGRFKSKLEKNKQQLFKRKKLGKKAREKGYTWNNEDGYPKRQYTIDLLKEAREKVDHEFDGEIGKLKADTTRLNAEIVALKKKLKDTLQTSLIKKQGKFDRINEVLKEIEGLKIDKATLGNVKVGLTEKKLSKYGGLEDSLNQIEDQIATTNRIMQLYDDMTDIISGNKECVDCFVKDSMIRENVEDTLKIVFDSLKLASDIILTKTVFSGIRNKTSSLTEYGDSLNQKKKELLSQIDSFNMLMDEIKANGIALDSIRGKLKNYEKDKNEMCGNESDEIKCIDRLGKAIKVDKDSIKEVQSEIEKLEAVMLQKTNRIYALRKDKKYQQSFVIDSVQVEFYEGFIENIWVVGRLELSSNISLKFENRAPIRFSSKKAYDRNNSVFLAATTVDAYWVLYMGDLIEYIQNHANGTKDYSPANGTVTWDDFKRPKSLYKKATSKLFEAHVYTDFVGFDENAPNGLVQTEISKRFNLWTKRFGSFLKKNAVYCRCRGPVYGANWGFMNFVKPSFVFSKYEQKRRNIEMSAQNLVINGQLRSTKFASTQRMLQHEMFSVGATVNLVTFDVPLSKSIFYLNTGFGYGRTEVTDSIYAYVDNKIQATGVNFYGINTIKVFGEIAYKITPEKRYGVESSIRFMWMRGFTNQPDPFLQLNQASQVTTLDQLDNDKIRSFLGLNQWMVHFEVSGFFRPDQSSDNKLFLRYRLTGQLSDLNYNFHQLQVGYSFYLLRSNLLKTQGPAASK